MVCSKFYSRICAIILPVALYEQESWPLAFRKKHRLKVFDNRVLRRIILPERGHTRKPRKLHEKLNNLYPSPKIIRVVKSR